jgi:hypothetical protein
MIEYFTLQTGTYIDISHTVQQLVTNNEKVRYVNGSFSTAQMVHT